MSGPFVHSIDPVIATVGGVHLWWYGLCYSVGMVAAHLSLRGSRRRLGLTQRGLWTLTLAMSIGALAGGRLVEVAFYEWPYYREHPAQIGALWLGGMSTHGLLLGGLVGMLLFAAAARMPFLAIADALVVPAALIMAFGRLGNFVDGQIVGSPTDLPWAVVFPDAAGPRHSVVLYDGVKNLLIVPVLLAIGRLGPPRGVRTGAFLLLYAGLRIVVDLFREYPTTLLGLATGQVLNLAFCAAGLWLTAVPLVRARRAGWPADAPLPLRAEQPPRARQPALFALLLAAVMVLPSDWTQDIPARYGKRHPGLTHSPLYPVVVPPK